MNKETQEKVDQILNLLIDGIGKAKQELPVLMEEYVNYFMVENVVDVISCLALILISSIAVVYYSKKRNEKGVDFGDKIDYSAFMVLCSIAMVLSAFFFSFHLKNVLKLKLAPKAYLIEQLRR